MDSFASVETDDQAQPESVKFLTTDVMRKHFNSSHQDELQYSKQANNLNNKSQANNNNNNYSKFLDPQNNIKAPANSLNTSKYNLASSRQQLMSDEMSQELTYLSREAPLDGGESTLAAPSLSHSQLAPGGDAWDHEREQSPLLAHMNQHEEPANVIGLDERQLSQLRADNVDIKQQNARAPPKLKQEGFLVSFLVDARGGAMRGCRHSGMRVIIPAGCAQQPMRITCRYLRRERLVHPPPLSEGEACASRIMEVGPVGAKFLGPVLIEVPHFASLGGDQNDTRNPDREIIILRSDNGQIWREHSNGEDLSINGNSPNEHDRLIESIIQAADQREMMNELHNNEENRVDESADESMLSNGNQQQQEKRLTRIITNEFPQYFAIISRVKQQIHLVGADGLTVNSNSVPKVQATFTEGALTKRIKIGLQKNDATSPKRRNRKLLACFGSSARSDAELVTPTSKPEAGDQLELEPETSGSSSADSGHQSPGSPQKDKLQAGLLKHRPSQLVPDDYYKLGEQEPPLLLNLEPTTYGKRLASSFAQTDGNAQNANRLSTHARPPKKRSRGLCSRRRQKPNQLTIGIEDPQMKYQLQDDTKQETTNELNDKLFSKSKLTSQIEEGDGIIGKAELSSEDSLLSTSKWRTCPIQTDSDSVTIQYVTIAQNPDPDASEQIAGDQSLIKNDVDQKNSNNNKQPGDDGYVSGSGGSLNKADSRRQSKEREKAEKKRAKEAKKRAKLDKERERKAAKKQQQESIEQENKDKKQETDVAQKTHNDDVTSRSSNEKQLTTTEAEAIGQQKEPGSQIESFDLHEQPAKVGQSTSSEEVGVEPERQTMREADEAKVQLDSIDGATCSSTKMNVESNESIEKLADELVSKTTKEAIELSCEQLAKETKNKKSQLKREAKQNKSKEKEAQKKEKEAKLKEKKEERKKKKKIEPEGVSTSTKNKGSLFSRLFGFTTKQQMPIKELASSSSEQERTDETKASNEHDELESEQKKRNQQVVISEMFPKDPNDVNGELVLEVNMPKSLIDEQLARHEQATEERKLMNEDPATAQLVASDSLNLTNTTISQQSASQDQPAEEDTLVNVSQLPSSSEPMMFSNENDGNRKLSKCESFKERPQDSLSELADDPATENQFSAPDLLTEEANEPPTQLDPGSVVISEPERERSEPENRSSSDMSKEKNLENDDSSRGRFLGGSDKARKEFESKLKREAEKRAKEERDNEKREAKEAAKRAKAEKKEADARRKRELSEQKERAKEEAKRLAKEAKEAQKKKKKLAKEGGAKKASSSSLIDTSQALDDTNAKPIEEQDKREAKGSSDDAPISCKAADLIVAENPEYASMIPVSEESEVKKFVEESVGDDGYVTRITKLVETKSVTLRAEETIMNGEERTNLNEDEIEIDVVNDDDEQRVQKQDPNQQDQQAKVINEKAETDWPVELSEICSTPSCFDVNKLNCNAKLQDPNLSSKKKDQLMKKELKKSIKSNEKLVKRALAISKAQSKLANEKCRQAQVEIPISAEAAKKAQNEVERARKAAKSAQKLSEAAHKKMDKVDKKLQKQQKKIDKKQAKLDKKAAKQAQKDEKKRLKEEQAASKKQQQEQKKQASTRSKKSIKLEDIGEPKLKSTSRMSLGACVTGPVAGAAAAAATSTNGLSNDYPSDQAVGSTSHELKQQEDIGHIEMHLEDTADHVIVVDDEEFGPVHDQHQVVKRQLGSNEMSSIEQAEEAEFSAHEAQIQKQLEQTHTLSRSQPEQSDHQLEAQHADNQSQQKLDYNSSQSHLQTNTSFQPHRLQEPLIEEPEPLEADVGLQESENGNGLEQIPSPSIERDISWERHDQDQHEQTQEPANQADLHNGLSPKLPYKEEPQANNNSNQVLVVEEEDESTRNEIHHDEDHEHEQHHQVEPTLAQYIQYQSEPTSMTDDFRSNEMAMDSQSPVGHDEHAYDGQHQADIDHEPQPVANHHDNQLESTIFQDQIHHHHQDQSLEVQLQNDAMTLNRESSLINYNDNNSDLVNFSPTPQATPHFSNQADDDSSFADDSISPEPIPVVVAANPTHHPSGEEILSAANLENDDPRASSGEHPMNLASSPASSPSFSPRSGSRQEDSDSTSRQTDPPSQEQHHDESQLISLGSSTNADDFHHRRDSPEQNMN